jgi:hypothetical protein
LQLVLSLAVVPLADISHLIPAEIFRVPFQFFARKRPCNQSSERMSHPHLCPFQESSSNIFVQALWLANISNLNLTATAPDSVLQDRSRTQLNKRVQDKQHAHQLGRGLSESSVMQMRHKLQVKSSRCSGHGSTLPWDHILRHLDWLPFLSEFDCGDDSFSRFGASSFKSRQNRIFKLAIPICNS